VAPNHPLRPLHIKKFKGLDSYTERELLTPDTWFESSNVFMVPTGTVATLRSPANFNTALAFGTNIISAFDYDKTSGNLILFDIDITGAGDTVRTYSTTGSSNTVVRSSQTDGAVWKRLTINDWAYSLNGTEFIQTDGTNNYTVGITAPAAAPTLSFVAGGSGSLASGVTVTYAYRNATTGHVSKMSATSASSGVSSNTTLRIAVTASGQTGVDGIVLFITQDGGSVRYLYIDTAGDPIVSANATANIDISLANITNLDTLTTETAFNSTPPATAFFMFKWKDRLCLCDFRGANTRPQIQFNGYESCYYGIPWESWPALNIINIPNKSDAARAGIETNIGALILGELDSYMIRGSLTDKVSSPEASISITEHMQPMGWSIGTRSPRTLVTTPYGKIWLNQNKQIQLWNEQGFPIEIAMPLRGELLSILNTDAARNMAEAVWFQSTNDAGFYILSASTTGTTNNKLFFLSIYKDSQDGQMRVQGGVSDIAAQCLLVAEVSGKMRCFIGIADRLREIFARDTAGAGWTTETLFFTINLTAALEYNQLYSLAFDGCAHWTVTILKDDGTLVSTVTQITDDGSVRGLVDRYGGSTRIKFTALTTDLETHTLGNLRLYAVEKKRVL